MTESSHPQTPAARPRPTVVAVSSYLLYAAAALRMISAIIELSFLGTTARVAREAAAGSGVEGIEAFTVAATAAAAGISLLFAAGLVILAIFNNRGRNPSRIVTWVVGGLAVCCGGGGLAVSALGSAMGNLATSGADASDAAEVQRRLDEALPGWYSPVTTTVNGLTLLAILAAVVMLALPAANAYFRRTAPDWAPPVQGYPPYPAAPYPAGPYPGQPVPGPSYPGQGSPGQPDQGYPGHGYPGQGQPGQGYPGQGYPGQPAPGHGYPPDVPGAAYPGAANPGPAYPPAGAAGPGGRPGSDRPPQEPPTPGDRPFTEGERPPTA